MPRIADTQRGNVVVPRLISTGIVVRITDDACDVDIDHAEDTEQVELCDRGEVFKLRWNTRRRVGRFLIIAKAWRGWNGQRRFRVQCHRVFHDGVIWWREILFETANGKVVKLVKNHDAIRVMVSGDAQVMQK